MAVDVRPQGQVEIKVLMNSSIEDVLSFKCCNLHDQNMEIHLKNLGPESLTVPGMCELVGKSEADRFRIETLFPVGPYTLPPGEVVACYCTLEDETYARYGWIVFHDTKGREHRAPLS